MQWLKELPDKSPKKKNHYFKKIGPGGHKARTGDDIPLMPIGKAADMGWDKNGIPLINQDFSIVWSFRATLILTLKS